MTVVEVRSYSLMTGSTSALTDSAMSGASRAAISLTLSSCAGFRYECKQADRDRLDPLAEQKPHRALDARLVERPVDAALGVDPLIDLDPQAALDERRRLGPRHVVEPRHPQIADFEHVAETPAS